MLTELLLHRSRIDIVKNKEIEIKDRYSEKFHISDF